MQWWRRRRREPVKVCGTFHERITGGVAAEDGPRTAKCVRCKLVHLPNQFLAERGHSSSSNRPTPVCTDKLLADTPCDHLVHGANYIAAHYGIAGTPYEAAVTQHRFGMPQGNGAAKHVPRAARALGRRTG